MSTNLSDLTFSKSDLIKLKHNIKEAEEGKLLDFDTYVKMRRGEETDFEITLKMLQDNISSLSDLVDRLCEHIDEQDPKRYTKEEMLQTIPSALKHKWSSDARQI